MTSHMNRVLAEQYVTDLRHVAERQHLAREARSNGRPGRAVRLMSALRGNDKPVRSARPAKSAPAAGCAPEH